MNPEIWALSDDETVDRFLTDFAVREDLHLRKFRTVPEALNAEAPGGGFLLAIDTSARFKNYLTIIKRFQKNFFLFDVIVFGETKTVESIERERESGVDLYVPFPIDVEDGLVQAAHLTAIRRLKSTASIIGRSQALHDMLETVLQVAPTEVSVLIQGESGSGKEITAKAIHVVSRRAERPFEAINCGALAEGVLESELFGHEKGAFTGAVARRQGLFERANKGTLFLDEVGEMSLNMQVRLLRVIDTGEFMRVGGSERLHTDARIIAATNRELETAVEEGRFRKDLYYRLRVVQIRIPPLRSRPEDIPLLVNFFLDRSSATHGRKIRGIEKEGMDLLLRYPWPGNVRELANMVDNLTVLSKETTIRAANIERRLQERMTTQTFPDLPVHVEKTREEMERELILNSLLSLHNDVREILHMLKGERVSVPGSWRRWVEVKEATSAETRDLSDMEREAIKEALSANGGNRRRAAKQLGISERTLYRRLKEYSLG
jgi:DNA-binding NtrC family response regulator